MAKITEAETVILIPAYNEEMQIGNAISLIRQTGIEAHIIVINDGSSDKTAEIARSMDCETIDMPRNVGKANAFFAGIRRAVQLNAKATVMLDADITGLPKNSLAKLVAGAQEATIERRAHMTVAQQAEGHQTRGAEIIRYSGQRSFSNMGLQLITGARTKSAARGFGLEEFLNRLFEGRTERVSHTIQTMRAFRHEGLREQHKAFERTAARMARQRMHGRRL